MKRYYLYRNAWRYEGAPDQETKLAKSDWQALLKQGGLLVRNTYDFDQQEESCFWYVIKDRFGGLEGFSSNERNKINRSTKELTFRKIGIELLKQEGWGILQATYADYAVSDRSMSKEVFLDYLGSCEKQAFDYYMAPRPLPSKSLGGNRKNGGRLTTNKKRQNPRHPQRLLWYGGFVWLRKRALQNFVGYR